MAKKALITGVNGFTGAYLKQLLTEQGIDVYGLGHSKSDEMNYFQVDLTDIDQVMSVLARTKPDYIYHLGAISFVGHDNADAFYHTNLIGTRHLLEATAKAAPNVQSVLISSSANVYGNQLEGQLDESAAINPANDYAVSKAAMEMMARLWVSRLPVFITRPFNYTGVGQSPHFLIPKIVSHFKDKYAVIELGNIDVWREFNDVRDVTKAYFQLAELCPVGEAVNICSGNVFSLRKVIELAEQITGHQLSIKVNPAFVRENEVKKLYGNPAKLNDLLPELTPTSFNDTLTWMLSSTD